MFLQLDYSLFVVRPSSDSPPHAEYVDSSPMEVYALPWTKDLSPG
jgi:hypothetical protein